MKRVAKKVEKKAQDVNIIGLLTGAELKNEGLLELIFMR